MTMSFEQLLLLSVAGDLVFTLVIAFAAFMFDRRLQERRARDETLKELAVRDPTPSDSRRRQVFSTLRTELKIDAGIYLPSERAKQTFVPRPSSPA